MLACWQTYRYFNIISNISQQKNEQKSTFFDHIEHIPFDYTQGKLTPLRIQGEILNFLLLSETIPIIIESADAEIFTIDLPTCIGNNSVSLVNKKSAK